MRSDLCTWLYLCCDNERNNYNINNCISLCYCVVLTQILEMQKWETWSPWWFPPGLDVNKIPDRWTFLKIQVYQEDRMEDANWAEVSRRAGHLYPDVLALIDILLSTPSSTAVCERGFGILKLVKYDWRCRIKSQTLSDLPTVQLSSRCIKDLDPNLCHWAVAPGQCTVAKTMLHGQSESDSDVRLSESEEQV